MARRSSRTKRSAAGGLPRRCHSSAARASSCASTRTPTPAAAARPESTIHLGPGHRRGFARIQCVQPSADLPVPRGRSRAPRHRLRHPQGLRGYRREWTAPLGRTCGDGLQRAWTARHTARRSAGRGPEGSAVGLTVPPVGFVDRPWMRPETRLRIHPRAP
jgi:hypothetical protein